jgi:Photosynthetic reaction centre cytochrome C subunit
MRPRKKTVVILLLIGCTAMAVSATRPEGNNSEWTNLKVLPQNLNDQQMDMLMERYSRQLGVGCLYCHVSTKPDIKPQRVDFVSDERPEKLIARRMIWMCIKINRKYFGISNYDQAVLKPKLTCRMCHRGFPRPELAL